MKKPRVAPPKTLSGPARGWWRKLVEEYDINEPAGLLLLETALSAVDRWREAQKLIKAEGMTIVDRFGQQKAHPATVVERDSRAGMLAALRALNLDIEPLRDQPGRPGGS